MPASLKDVMERTMTNLRYVQSHQAEGIFEVTQLVNSCLCALIQPWDGLDKGTSPWNLSIAKAEANGWPQVTHGGSNHQPNTLGDLIQEMRNALSHGQIQYLDTGTGDIMGLRLWTNHAPKYVAQKWCGELTVEGLKDFLQMFVRLTGA